jgi:hypothetical protein
MKIFYPKNTLSAALKAAEPLMANTAIGRAETGLAAIRGQCLAQLDELLASLVALPAQAPDVRVRLKQAYHVSRRIIGLGHVAGFPQVDMAALNLCDVADGLITRNLCEWPPIEAHIDAMRLLRHADIPEAAIAMLLSSLHELRARFGCASIPASA